MRFLTCLCWILLPSLFYKPGYTEDKISQQEIEKYSEILGYLIYKNLKEEKIPYNLDHLIRGIQKGASSNSSLSSEKYENILFALQEKILNNLRQKNLEKANAFLQENSKKEKIIEIERGKLQYKIEKKGKGSRVESYHHPLVKLTCKTPPNINLTYEEVLPLDEAMLGLKKGIEGMQEKEIRTIYIHPHFGYQKENSLNSLLIYEVEVLQVDGACNQKLKFPSELAKQKIVR